LPKSKRLRSGFDYMEWLKKHWMILAGVGLVIVIVYFFLENQSNSSNNSANAQAAADAQQLADEQQLNALQSLGLGVGSSSLGGASSVSQPQATITYPTAATPTSPTSPGTPISVASIPTTGISSTGGVTSTSLPGGGSILLPAGESLSDILAAQNQTVSTTNNQVATPPTAQGNYSAPATGAVNSHVRAPLPKTGSGLIGRTDASSLATSETAVTPVTATKTGGLEGRI
jgi:hypothetical protein